MSKGIKGNHKHGLNRTCFYNKFTNLKQRTGNPKNLKYPSYGGRGIRCLWLSFQAFKDDMYESYQTHVASHGEQNTTLERIDNNGNYCKENCRWATPLEQAQNTRNTRLLEYEGKIQSIRQWEKDLKLKRGLLGYHLGRKRSITQAVKIISHGKQRVSIS